MPANESTELSLRAENAELRARLEEAEETLRAIRGGGVDALVVEGDAGPQLFTLQGHDAEQSRLHGEMLAQVIDAVIAVDTEDRVTFLNAAAERQYGVRAGDMLGRQVAEVFTPSWAGTDAEAAMRTALRECGEWRGELIHHTHGGRELHVESAVTMLLDRAGVGIGCVMAIRDISARRQDEAALRFAKQRFDLAVKCSQVVLWQQDLELRFTWLHNPAPGIDGSDAVGKRDEDLLERAEDAAVIVGLKREVIRSGVGMRQEFFPQIQGVGHCFEVLMEPLRNAAGLVTGITGAAIDITERKATEKALEKSERTLRYALQAARAGVWGWDIRSGDIVWSPENYQLYDVDPAQGPPRYADWESRLHPEDRDRANENVRAVVEGREGEFRTEFRIFSRQGAMRWLLGLGRVEYDGNGQPLRMSGLNLDITERKRAEEVLRDNAVTLADLARRKDAFLATLAHELRNPLGVIGNSLHLLRTMGQDRDAVQQSCARMQRQVVLLKRLIDDLLDISRIDHDKLTLQTELLDLATVAQSAVENSRTVLDQRGHTVNVVLPPEPIKVDGDATRLAQVVSNLLTNAAKYSDPGSPIALTVERQGDVAAVAVRDRGIGIAPADLRRVFELFAQVSGPGNLAQGGLGIGLNLVQRVVELHGGSVEARSDGLGHGSEFLVRLPLASAGGLGARSLQTTKSEVAPQISTAA